MEKATQSLARLSRSDSPSRSVRMATVRDLRDLIQEAHRAIADLLHDLEDWREGRDASEAEGRAALLLPLLAVCPECSDSSGVRILDHEASGWCRLCACGSCGSGTLMERAEAWAGVGGSVQVRDLGPQKTVWAKRKA